MNKFMRILIFFDLPVKTKTERREATRFRNFLLNDGYHMVQYSVYARVCNGTDAVEKHRQRVARNLPDNGAIRMLVITEKQYESIDITHIIIPYQELSGNYNRLRLTMWRA